MAQLKNNSFTGYSLTEQELGAAVQLSPLQVMYFQTLQSDTAEMLLGLRFTPNDVFKYAQEEAYLRAQLELLNYLLAQDSSAKLAVSQEEVLSRANSNNVAQTEKGIQHEQT